MKPFIEWMDGKGDGYWVRDAWDVEKNTTIGEGKLILFPRHRRILSRALEIVGEGDRQHFKYETTLFSDIKKTGKTALSGAVACWYAEEARPGTEIYVIANTLEQGEGRVMRDIKFHFEKRNTERGSKFSKQTQFRIELHNGTFIQVLAQSFRSAAGSRHALTLWDELWGACLTPDTKILRDDLTWVPAGELKEGEGLIAFDDEKQDRAGYRNWKYGKVTSTGRRILPCVDITLSNGKKITATLEHKWLVRRKQHNSVEWVSAEDMKPGYRLMRVLDTWEVRQDYDAGYIAGALDGEGHLTYNKQGGVRLGFTQRPNIMWDEMQRLLDVAYDTGKKIKPGVDSRGIKYGTARDMIVTGKSDIMKILGSTRPKRLMQRFDVENLGRQTAIEWVEVESVSEPHDAEVVALTTSTQTYISDGYCSHNTNEFDRRTWDEMVPIPTIPLSLRFISSYAGFENESELLWELYLRGVGEDEHPKGKGERIDGLNDLPCWVNGDMFTYWSHESDLPWYTEEYIQKQMDSERPAAFLRLFMNQWVTSHEEFIPVEWWDRAAKSYSAPATLWDEHPFRYMPISIAVDAGIRRDTTALVGVGYDSRRGKVGVAFHKIWKPSPGDPVDLEATVEKELVSLYNKFTIATIAYDPTHLMTIMLRLQRLGMPTRSFDQTLPNMTSASQLLYDLMRARNLEAYEDSDLRRHIQMSVAETTSRGFRIVKSKTSKVNHNDLAIALAMACHAAVSTGGADISVPITILSPYAETSTLGNRRNQLLPKELQTDDDDYE
jgi:hypothetical protein